MWQPLREFFDKECETKQHAKKDEACAERHERCKGFLRSQTAKAFCLFLIYALEMFDRANQALQFEKPLLHKSRRIQLDLYRNVLLKILKPSAFSSKELLKVDFKASYNQKDNKDIVLGEKCRSYMKSRKLPEEKIKRVCDNARTFYQKGS